jgi:hypothetical protein
MKSRLYADYKDRNLYSCRQEDSLTRAIPAGSITLLSLAGREHRLSRRVYPDPVYYLRPPAMDSGTGA